MILHTRVQLTSHNTEEKGNSLEFSPDGGKLKRPVFHGCIDSWGIWVSCPASVVSMGFTFTHWLFFPEKALLDLKKPWDTGNHEVLQSKCPYFINCSGHLMRR
jgi:hypothetical protein